MFCCRGLMHTIDEPVCVYIINQSDNFSIMCPGNFNIDHTCRELQLCYISKFNIFLTALSFLTQILSAFGEKKKNT
jgi:hypothetical protein